MNLVSEIIIKNIISHIVIHIAKQCRIISIHYHINYITKLCMSILYVTTCCLRLDQKKLVVLLRRLTVKTRTLVLQHSVRIVLRTTLDQVAESMSIVLEDVPQSNVQEEKSGIRKDNDVLRKPCECLRN